MGNFMVEHGFNFPVIEVCQDSAYPYNREYPVARCRYPDFLRLFPPEKNMFFFLNVPDDRAVILFSENTIKQRCNTRCK